jgi:hypothetical protein
MLPSHARPRAIGEPVDPYDLQSRVGEGEARGGRSRTRSLMMATS